MKMYISSSRNILMLLTVSVFIASCNTPTTTENGGQCIQPKLDAVPTQIPLYWDTQAGIDPRPVPRREPTPPWLVPQLTWMQRRQIPDVEYSIDMETNGNVVWMVYRNFITRYDNSTQILDIYELARRDPSLRLDDILVTKDHNIWVLGSHLSKDDQYSLLMQYNSKTDAFDIVDDVDGLLKPAMGVRERIILFGQDNGLKEAPNGDILFVFRGGIYSYSPSNNRVVVIFSDPTMIVSTIESDPRTIIWFTVLDDDRVWMVNPDTSLLQSFELPELYSGTQELYGLYFRNGYELYMDTDGRLWIPAWAFLDTSEEEFTWQVLKPDALFVDLYDDDYVYSWDAATTLEAQDGSLWFTSMNGVIQYDLQSQSACWIVPRSGPIAEAQDGTIWILLNDQLYRYDP